MTRIAAILLGTSILASPLYAQDRQVGDLPIAIQMFTLREHGDLDAQLAAVQAAGINAVETVGMHGLSAEELKAELDEYGIKPISTHAPLADIRADLAEVIAFNKGIGNDVITVPFLAEADRPTDAAGWTKLGEELEGYAQAANEAGMRFAYHNHAFELVDFEGKTGLDLLFAAAPSMLAELDVAWVHRAGIDPSAYLASFDGRLFAIHAKDTVLNGEEDPERGFRVLGEGELDFSAVLPAAEAAGAEWYIIEHDKPLNAADVATLGAQYLAKNLSQDATRP